MNLLIMGAPGAGKGTQADVVSKQLNIPVISTGNILWAAANSGSELGNQIKGLMEQGALVSDEIIIDIVKERIQENDCKNGFILDGMPRNVSQAKALDENGVIIDKALFIEVSDDEILNNRMTGRLTCPNCRVTYHKKSNPPKVDGICDKCGSKLTVRQDDNYKTMQNRLKVFHSETEPLLAHYESVGKLCRICGEEPISVITQQILKALEDQK